MVGNSYNIWPSTLKGAGTHIPLAAQDGVFQINNHGTYEPLSLHHADRLQAQSPSGNGGTRQGMDARVVPGCCFG